MKQVESGPDGKQSAFWRGGWDLGPAISSLPGSVVYHTLKPLVMDFDVGLVGGKLLFLVRPFDGWKVYGTE